MIMLRRDDYGELEWYEDGREFLTGRTLTFEETKGLTEKLERLYYDLDNKIQLTIYNN